MSDRAASEAAREAELRALVARASRNETAPARDLVGGALKRLRFRRYAALNANEVGGTIATLLSGLATLWGAKDRNA